MELLKNALNGGNFFPLVPFSNEELYSAIAKLRKASTIFNLSEDYVNFLEKYGGLMGCGLEIIGPMEESYHGSVAQVVARQRGFQSGWKYYTNGTVEEEIKNIWLIGSYEDIQYFIDASPKGKSHIFSLDFEGRKRRFSKNFLQFLEQILQIVELQNSDDFS